MDGISKGYCAALTKMRKLLILIFVFGLLSCAVFAQNKPLSENVTETYWLKYSLIFFQGCQPVVSPDNIIFTKGGDHCVVVPYDGKILPRGTQIQLNSASKKYGSGSVSFTVDSTHYEVALKQNSKSEFIKSFQLLFTKKKLAEFYPTKCRGDIKTRKQMIRCLGFPIIVGENDGIESNFYIIEFTGGNYFGSYDGFTVKIKNGKVIDISGYI